MGAGSRYDTIVVGTGPAGATVARELSRAGRNVLILERGGARAVTGGLLQTARELGMPGKSLLLTHGLVAMVRAITTGGSSIYFHGTAYDPPFEMLDRHGIDLRGEIAEAKSELPIAPLPDDLIGPKGVRIMQSAQECGLDWHPLPKFIYQDRAREGGWLGYYEAPSYESKWNARMWVEDAVGAGAELITHAKVERVILRGGCATGVEYSVRGRSFTAEAERVVLAAGGIGSPAILRASGVAGVGHDFFFDPLIGVMGEVDGVSSGPEMPMQTGIHCQADGYMLTDMTVPKSLYAMMTGQVGRFHKLGAYSRTLQIMVKAKDALGGRLTDRGGVRKRLAEEDKAKLVHGYKRARQVLENAGAKGVYKSWYVAAHPGGTVKVGEFVDSDLQTEYENLYVCDCSVIPEPWGLPPTLTLIGLGKRLATHLTRAALPRTERSGNDLGEREALELAVQAQHATRRRQR